MTRGEDNWTAPSKVGAILIGELCIRVSLALKE
jgi:hypothetical protein